MYPLLLPLPPTLGLHPAHLGHHRAPRWAPCAISRLPTDTCFTHGSLHPSISISQFISHHLSPSPIIKTLKYLTRISKPICQQSSHVYILTKLWLLFSPKSEVQMHYPALQFSSNALDNKRRLGSEYDKTRKHLHFWNREREWKNDHTPNIVLGTEFIAYCSLN